MLRNYFKIALRNLLKNKVFSFINIAGLAMGMAVSMLILLYVSHEMSFDTFHPNSKRIFHTLVKMNFGGNEIQFNRLSKNFGPAVKQANPEVEEFARIGLLFRENTIIKSDEEHHFFEKSFYFSEPSLFKILAFEFLEGSPQSALSEPNSVVITEEVARKYFGNQNALGKTLTYNKTDLLKVAGVVKKFPTNSSLHYDFIASLSTFEALMKRSNPNRVEADGLVGTGDYETYFLLNKPESEAKVEKVIPQLLTDKKGMLENHSQFVLEPLTAMHLGNNWGDFSNTKYVMLFLCIAGIVLLLALINYMSLTTARSTIRAKEVGVRKVLGANRNNLASQFYGESILISLISFALALVLFQVLKQSFYGLLDLNIDDSFVTSPLFLSILLVLVVITALIAGSYPALLLSKFSPLLILKGKLSSANQGAALRRGFIVFQFAVSVVLIVFSIVVQRQLSYMQTKKIGMNKQQVLVVTLSKEAQKHYAAFRNDLSQSAGIEKIGASSMSLFNGGWNMFFTKMPTTNEDVSINNMTVDENFFDLLELEWKTKPADMKDLVIGTRVLINETAVGKLKIADKPIGKKLDLSNEKAEIVGVLKDFNFTSLQSKIEAMLFQVVKDTTSLKSLYLRLDPKTDFQQKIASIENIYKKYESEVPFDYYFLDEAFNKQYRAEQRMGNLFAGFTGIAIFIACMGLFGLITFTAEQKTKEIGVRKVLGASVVNIVSLLSKDFLRLVLISNGIAFPIAYYIIHQWLQDFAYQTDVSADIFILAGVLAIVIALLTVIVQATKAALVNPVQSLKSE